MNDVVLGNIETPLVDLKKNATIPIDIMNYISTNVVREVQKIMNTTDPIQIHPKLIEDAFDLYRANYNLRKGGAINITVNAKSELVKDVIAYLIEEVSAYLIDRRTKSQYTIWTKVERKLIEDPVEEGHITNDPKGAAWDVRF